MLDDYSTFAAFSIHIGDGYEVSWGTDRRAFYGGCADGFPWFAYDGLFDAWPINTYEDKFLARQAEPTDVTIELIGNPAAGTDTYDITATVCMDPGGVQTSMRISMIQVLDHYPDSPDYNRNCLMQGAATEDVLVSPGECVDVVRTFTFDTLNMSRQDDIKIIAWAQTPGDSWPAEIFQAAQMGWPFPNGIDIFLDGFESGDTTMWSYSGP